MLGTITQITSHVELTADGISTFYAMSIELPTGDNFQVKLPKDVYDALMDPYLDFLNANQEEEEEEAPTPPPPPPPPVQEPAPKARRGRPPRNRPLQEIIAERQHKAFGAQPLPVTDSEEGVPQI